MNIRHESQANKLTDVSEKKSVLVDLPSGSLYQNDWNGVMTQNVFIDRLSNELGARYCLYDVIDS